MTKSLSRPQALQSLCLIPYSHQAYRTNHDNFKPAAETSCPTNKRYLEIYILEKDEPLKRIRRVCTQQWCGTGFSKHLPHVATIEARVLC